MAVPGSAPAVHALVVNDEEHLARLVADYLAGEGFTAQIALDGERALELAREQPPDVVILDLMLPGIDGVEVRHHSLCSGAAMASHRLPLMGTPHQASRPRPFSLPKTADISAARSLAGLVVEWHQHDDGLVRVCSCYAPRLGASMSAASLWLPTQARSPARSVLGGAAASPCTLGPQR